MVTPHDIVIQLMFFLIMAYITTRFLFFICFVLHWPIAERISQTVEITKHTVAIEEKGVKLKLTIVDTPGFGDAVNNTERWNCNMSFLLEYMLDFVDTNTVAHFQFCNLDFMLIVIAGGQLWTTLTSSLSNTFVTKVASTVKTFRTTVCTAASTSSHLMATGNTSWLATGIWNFYVISIIWRKKF